jgi:hypothetical protein
LQFVPTNGNFHSEVRHYNYLGGQQPHSYQQIATRRVVAALDETRYKEEEVVIDTESALFLARLLSEGEESPLRGGPDEPEKSIQGASSWRGARESN